MARGKKAHWRRQTSENQTNFSSQWGHGTSQSTLGGVAAYVGLGGGTGATSGDLELHGTRMVVDKAAIRISGLAMDVNVKPVSEHDNCIILCAWWRGSGAIKTDANAVTAVNAAIAEGTTAQIIWAQLLEGEEVATEAGSIDCTVKLVRHKYMPYNTNMRSWFCSLNISRCYLNENQWLGWTVAPVPGSTLTYTNTAQGFFAIQQDVRYALQGRLQGIYRG